LSMVCTMGYVHTILRDTRLQFKVGSPGAYDAGWAAIATDIASIEKFDNVVDDRLAALSV